MKELGEAVIIRSNGSYFLPLKSDSTDQQGQHGNPSTLGGFSLSAYVQYTFKAKMLRKCKIK